MNLDPERVQQALNNHQAEIHILRFIVFALFEQCSDKNVLIARLQGCVESAVANAPLDTHPEIIVELRAHAEFYYRELSALAGPASSGRA